MAATYNNLYLDARRALKAAGSDNAQLEAQELLSFSAKKNRQELFRDMALYASPAVAEQFEALMKRRLAGEPVAYLVGEWDFYGLSLDISPDVLVPRDDTEILARQAIERVQGYSGEVRVLDLCAGSGCVGLAIAKNCPDAKVLLGDISEGALRICRQNTRRNGLTAQVSSCQVDALEKPSAALWDFDVIAANPPYIPTGDLDGLEVAKFEPRLALDGGTDGLDFYRAITEKWVSTLRPGGWLLCEVGIGQVGKVEELFARCGLREIQSYQDTGDIWRVVEGRLER